MYEELLKAENSGDIQKLSNYYTKPIVSNKKVLKIEKILFNVICPTQYGNELGVTGSINELGSWNEENLMYLNWNEGNDWIGILNIDQNSIQDFEFKFVVTNNKKVACWESGNNNKFDLKEILNIPPSKKLIIIK